MNWANMPEDEPIESGVITNTISQAQIRMEGHNFDVRKRVLEYDDVVNKQREVIYDQRREWLQLDPQERRETYKRILEELVTDVIDEYLDEEILVEDLDFEGMYRQLLTIFPVPEDITPETLAEMDEEDIEPRLLKAVDEAYEQKREAMTDEYMEQAEKAVMVMAVDQLWQQHLTDLDMLREGIWTQSLQQRNPLVEYRIAGFEMWQDLQDKIREQAGRNIFRVRVNMPQPKPKQNLKLSRGSSGAAEKGSQTVRNTKKDNVGRNDPCWCGSGKKYKHCHYKKDRKERAKAMAQ